MRSPGRHMKSTSVPGNSGSCCGVKPSLEKKPDSHYIETADDFIVTRPELHLEEGDAGSNEVIIEEKGPLEEWQD